MNYLSLIDVDAVKTGIVEDDLEMFGFDDYENMFCVWCKKLITDFDLEESMTDGFCRSCCYIRGRYLFTEVGFVKRLSAYWYLTRRV